MFVRVCVCVFAVCVCVCVCVCACLSAKNYFDEDVLCNFIALVVHADVAREGFAEEDAPAESIVV